MMKRLQTSWLEKSPTERFHLHVLLLVMAGYLLHYLAYSVFFIEDAAITYSYSRNFALGEGFVTYAGGEHVEGYSNPLWTLLLSFFYLLKIPPFFMAKLLGGLFGAVTLFFVYGITRACRPGKDDHVALIPPILLAGSTTFVIWNASGLENSLFNLLLAAGLYRTIREGQQASSLPISALCFFGLAITRPEGIVYAAIAGFFRLIMAIQAKRVVKPILAWLAVFWIPFLAYHLWRYNYFGWLWPNTYYAKLDGEDRFKPFRFGGRGWVYASKYMKAYWLVYLLPLYAVGLATITDVRRYFVLFLTAIGMMLFLWTGREMPGWASSEHAALHIVLGLIAVIGLGFSGYQIYQRRKTTPQWIYFIAGLALVLLSVALLLPDELPKWWPVVRRYWDHTRVWFLLGGAASLGLLTLFHPGGLARLMVLCIGCAAFFFVIYSGGDWMKQWRWFSLVSIPNFILLGLGIGALADAFPRRTARSFCWVLVGVVLTPNLIQTLWSPTTPEPETSVADVRARVVYMSGVQDRMHLDRVTLLDVDMGAHMWFTQKEELRHLGVVSPSWQIVDMAGLVDVPMARHIYQEAFMEEYVFQERNPTFAHVHGGWASKTRIPKLKLWKTDYIEIPGYGAGRSLHMGNHIRKDLIIHTDVEANPERRVDFSEEVALLNWDIPAPIVAQNGNLYIDLWLKSGLHGEDFRFYVVLNTKEGKSHIASLPPGYDWYTPSEWGQDEVFRGKFDFHLPKHLEPGTYDIGFFVIDSETGTLLYESVSELPRNKLTQQVIQNEQESRRTPNPTNPKAKTLTAAGAQNLVESIGDRYSPYGDFGDGEYGFVHPDTEQFIKVRTGTTAGDAIAKVVQTPHSTASKKTNSLTTPFRVINGTHFFPDAIEIVDFDRAHAEADADFETATQHAEKGRCEDAWESWRQARYHVWRDLRWRSEHHDKISKALAHCYVQRALATETQIDQISTLLQAKSYNHRISAYKNAAYPLAKRLSSEGHAALADKEYATAYPLLRDAVGLNPNLAKTRRAAEKARDKKLGIISKEKDYERKRRERQETRDKRKEDRIKLKRKKKKKRNPRITPDRPQDAPQNDQDIAPNLPPNMPRLPTRMGNPPKIAPRPSLKD